MNFKIAVPPPFSFLSTVYSHGWVDLPPFQLNSEEQYFDYTFSPDENSIISFRISGGDNSSLLVQTEGKLTAAAGKKTEHAVICMFRLNEDYSSFYRLARAEKKWKWIISYSAGRMLRCASLWEDMVKMLCTTNCTWNLTKIMTGNLVAELGKEKGSKHSFPAPEIIAGCDEQYLRQRIKMGYRAPYLLEFADRVASGKIDLNQLENREGTSDELYKALRAIKGFGDYSVSSLLKLLGFYDRMGYDSWNRIQFAKKHNSGTAVEDKEIAAYYKRYDSWAGLFFWMDVTEHWYKNNFKW